MGKLSSAEVLRLRATSAVSPDGSVRRSAQDDDLSGGLNTIGPISRKHEMIERVTASQYDDAILNNIQSSLRDSIRDSWLSHKL
jgi:hypothetical protein